MLKLFGFVKKGIYLFVNRLQTQGLRLTLLWLYGRGVPLITGIPIMKYSQITPQIYVGPQYRQAGKRKLEQLGINGDLNLRIEFNDAAHDLALKNYCYLPTIDDTAPTLEQLAEGITFIRQVMVGGGKVYIHCQGGIGRAPTMAAAYFINQGLKLDEAIELIKKSRPFIKIMPQQMDQLKRFERLGHREHSFVNSPLNATP
jgi:protein-tyrosine phosphatase